jgi:hypothetical protein
VEFGPQRHVVKWSAAADSQVDPNIRPYSLAVVENLDRVVTSSADMVAAQESHVVQVWRLHRLHARLARRLEGERHAARGRLQS